MRRCWAYNRFGVLMGASWRASCSRWLSLRGNPWPMITPFFSQGRFCATAITEILIAAFILHHHFVPTTAAIDQALEQGRPLARYPPTFVVLVGGIVVIDNPLNACKRLPRNVGRVTVVHDHLPLG